MDALRADGRVCYTRSSVKKISLRAKLTTYSSLLVLGVVFSVGASLYLTERYYLVQQAQQKHLEVVQFLAQVGREAAGNKNNLLLSSYLSLIGRSRALSYAMVLDSEGTVVAHSNVVEVGRRPTDPVGARALAATQLLRQVVDVGEDELVDLALPIYLEGRRIGTARVGYSRRATQAIVDEALQATRHRIALATALCLIFGILGAVLMAYAIFRPIEHLREGARKIGTGDLEHRISVVSRDELGELAEDFNIMAAKLQELDRLKQDFVSNVTHELRSPLTSLRGYVEFLLREGVGPLNDEQRENLIVVKNNALRLGRFIDNLLDVAKIESKKVELHPENISLRAAAEETRVVFRPQAEEKKIDVVNDIPKDLSPVWADPDKLAEILMNLVSNAVKFTPEGGRVTMQAREEDGAVRITVRDTGIGVPAQALESVFNKFEQVKPTQGLARKTKGTGLGLTIVKGFVEAHGGRVWIENPSGMGATVHFTLPRKHEDPPTAFQE
jgi:signal transduction histidine kinase